LASVHPNDDRYVDVSVIASGAANPETVDLVTDDGKYRGMFRIWYADPNRPLAFVSYRSLVARQGKRAKLIWERSTPQIPSPSASEAMRAIAATHQIVYYVAGETHTATPARQWLSQNGFPDGAVLTTAPGGDFLSKMMSHEGMKEQVAKTRSWARSPMVGIGIGEDEGKVLATAALTKLIMFPEDANVSEREFAKDYPASAVRVRHWNEVGAHLGVAPAPQPIVPPPVPMPMPGTPPLPDLPQP